jgi:hypothetical protein
MLTPKRPLSSIALALTVVSLSETAIVGGDIEIEQQALTVSPHGRPSTSVVTITTPAASRPMASLK